ncbi:hypothetical protein MKX01_025899 [Papaver californicum]|nr:hypothetical protein MKX01_025899 [Papaver californicum]
MSKTLAAILGGAAGAVALVGIIIFLWFCLFRNKSISRTSESGSSDPSVQVGRNVGTELSLRGGINLQSEAKRFALEELAVATKNFSDINLMGNGKFGDVYKGLLQDGMIVAIKKRPGAPSQEFVVEVRYLSSIQHRNLVSLLGYCQENNQQMLVYEYIPNGSVSSHINGESEVPEEKLEFKHRLPIALGAAKGLAHLHTMSPPLVHQNFKTANVLVDENFIAKVADAGIHNLLGKVDMAGTSSQVMADHIFLAPEVREFKRFSERSDVYSFGVFLLELVSGREAMQSSESDQSLVEWDWSHLSTIIDHKLGSSYTAEVMKEFIQLTAQCVDTSSQRRPTMNHVVTELDRILEKERSLTTIMGEGTPIFTLGSQLFTTTATTTSSR